jgi:hypothetical protein
MFTEVEGLRELLLMDAALPLSRQINDTSKFASLCKSFSRVVALAKFQSFQL